MKSILTKSLLTLMMTSFISSTSKADETLLQTVRVFYRLGMGMTQAEYDALVAEQPDVANVTGADGFVGKLDDMRATVGNAILANNSAIASCEDVPSSGSFTSGTLQVTYGTPQHSAPAGYPNGGGSPYEKRVSVVQTNGSKTTTAVFEFNCGVAAMMLAYKLVDTNTAANNHKMALFFDGEDNTDKHFQFYLDWPDADVHMGVIMEISSNLYRSWISSGKTNGTTGYRMAAVGHLDTGAVSFFADDTTSVSAGGPGDTAVTSANAPNAGLPYQGCATSFDQDPSTIASNALCGADSLNVGTSAILTDLSTATTYSEVPTKIDLLLAN